MFLHASKFANSFFPQLVLQSRVCPCLLQDLSVLYNRHPWERFKERFMHSRYDSVDRWLGRSSWVWFSIWNSLLKSFLLQSLMAKRAPEFNSFGTWAAEDKSRAVNEKIITFSMIKSQIADVPLTTLKYVAQDGFPSTHYYDTSHPILKVNEILHDMFLARYVKKALELVNVNRYRDNWHEESSIVQGNDIAPNGHLEATFPYMMGLDQYIVAAASISLRHIGLASYVVSGSHSDPKYYFTQWLALNTARAGYYLCTARESAKSRLTAQDKEY